MRRDLESQKSSLAPSLLCNSPHQQFSAFSAQVPTAQALEKGGAQYLGVDTLEEGLTLRRSGITVPILILYWSDPYSSALMAAERLEPTVWDAGWLAAAAVSLSSVGRSTDAQPLNVHIHVDTGLGREGCLPDEAVRLGLGVKALEAQGVGMRVRGLATHLCCPKDSALTSQHHAMLLEVKEELRKSGVVPDLIHSASGGPATLYPDTQGDMVRIGGLLFGILPGAKGITEKLASAGALPQRAMRWLTTLVQVKLLPEGWCVGYECKIKSPQGGGKVGLLPLGSHDGFLEPSSGFKSVLIRGVTCGVLAVDANVVVVDVGLAEGASVGDEVIILGCEELNPSACVFPTLSTRIPQHLPRIFV